MQANAAVKPKLTKKDHLQQFFNEQIRKLEKRGCPELVVDKLQIQRTAVINEAFNASFDAYPIPFIPVIPQCYLTVYSQMNMLRHNGDRGETHLNLSDFEDLDITPQGPYYIYGVDKGDMNMILRTDSRIIEIERDLERSIKNQRRYCLTIVEAISIALHTDILNGCLVLPLASKFCYFLGLGANDVPTLDPHPENILNDWCIPSYAFRKCYIK